MKKKFLAFGLTAVMVLGSAISVFAVDTVNYEDGLTGYYTFDDTLENAAGSDGAAAALHGAAGETWNTPATGAASYAAGKNGKAYKFNGAKTEGLELDVRMGAAYTVSFWANPSAVTRYSSILFSPVSLNTGLNIADNWGGNSFPTVRMWGVANVADVYLDNFTTAADTLCGTWTYVTLTCNASGKMALYINGVLVQEGQTGAGVLADMPIFLGINFWDTTYNGLLDDVAVYNKALTASEVSALYAKNGVPVVAEEEPSEEQPTSNDSPQGGNVETPTPKPDENPSTNPGEQDTSKDDNKPGEDETTAPSPNGGNEEAVKATVVTAEVAKAVAEAAKITNADGKVLDVVLTATPVEDTTAVAGLIAADKALEAAKVKAFAVLDLELKVGDKKVTYLDNKVNVTIPMDKIFTDINADETVAVYRVDKDMTFSFLGTAKVAADKTITFATDHFTQYVFAVVDNAEALKDVQIADSKVIYAEDTPDVKVADIPVKANASVDDPDQNKTGDTTPIMPLVILAVVALGGVVAVVASKKRA